MDRTMASEAVGSGSIPLGTTSHKAFKLWRMWTKELTGMGEFKTLHSIVKCAKMSRNVAERYCRIFYSLIPPKT